MSTTQTNELFDCNDFTALEGTKLKLQSFEVISRTLTNFGMQSMVRVSTPEFVFERSRYVESVMGSQMVYDILGYSSRSERIVKVHDWWLLSMYGMW